MKGLHDARRERRTPLAPRLSSRARRRAPMVRRLHRRTPIGSDMLTHQGPFPAFARPGRSGTERVGAILHTDSSPQRSGPPPMLQGLSDEEVLLVMRRGARRILNRGATIFNQGTQHDGIYLIESGRVRVFYISPAGREVTLAYWHPGNFVGGPEVFGDSLHVWTGVAAANSSVLHLKADVLRKLIAEIPALGIGVIECLSFKGKCYSAMAQMLGTRSISERLAHLLLHLADLYGVEGGDGIVIATFFTHADLAHLVGSTRQWVTVSMKRLAEQGVVVKKGSDVVIRDLAELRRLRDSGAGD